MNIADSFVSRLCRNPCFVKVSKSTETHLFSEDLTVCSFMIILKMSYHYNNYALTLLSDIYSLHQNTGMGKVVYLPKETRTCKFG